MATLAPAEIRLVDLEKHFGGVRAVDGVSLEVRAGEFFSLLGPSGCGKTTTLRMIGGFELPTGGTIMLRDRDVTMDPPDKRPVNMVFQSYALFPHLDVGDNVAFGLKRRRVEKSEITRRVGEALDLVRLGGYERRKPNQLSGGQQQRVALARALVNRPNVLLLDEPLGALDLKLRRQLQIELKRIQVEVGITFVYVTHDQEEALTMSDRIAVMHAGKVEQLGTPEELYERPSTRFVADFIGTTNLLRGRVESDGSVRLSSGEIAPCVHDRMATGSEIELSIRPESISLVPRDAHGAIRGRVSQAAYLGNIVSYQVRTDGGLDLTVLSPKTGIRLPAGSDIAITWPAADALVLGGGSVRPGGGANMSHAHDGSSIDLEQALVRYMVERRVSRRQLLEAVAKLGPAVALAPIIAACSSAGVSPSAAASASASAAASAAVASAAPSVAPSVEPTPVPTPEAELFVYNWTDYIGDQTIPSFEKKYGVKVTYDFFSNTDEAYAKLGSDGGGYDVSFPISVDIPAFVAKNALLTLDKSLIPNIVNLGPEWADPKYDPGNAHSVPYMWWTTGVAYDTAKIKDTLTSSKALWDPRWSKHISMLDDWQEVFAMALIQLGLDANSTNPADLDRALALLQQQKPLVRVYSTDTGATMSSGDVWIGQVWGSDLYQINQENENMVFYLPEEGAVRGSDTIAIFSGTKHPIAAHLFINHLLDAHVSADNTNFIGYMGPNAAAKAYIDPAILNNPAVNPDQALVDKLYELLDLGQDVRDEYLTRWQTLRGG